MYRIPKAQKAIVSSGDFTRLGVGPAGVNTERRDGASARNKDEKLSYGGGGLSESTMVTARCAAWWFLDSRRKRRGRED
jgi:hypothetical protein